MQNKANIFTSFLDDDLDMHDLVKNVMERNGFPKGTYEITHDPEVFLSKIVSSEINLYVIDHRLNTGVTGLDIIRKVKSISKDSYVIIITGQGDYKIVAQYLREGADDYVDKNEAGYFDVMIKSILRGIDMSKERIDEAYEREEFRKEMLVRALEREDLFKQLK